MLRFLFILLLILNGLAVAAVSGWLALPTQHGEPERIRNQLNPERIRLLTRDGRDLAAATTPPAQNDTPPESTTTAPADSPICTAWSALSADDADKLESRLIAAGLSPRRSGAEAPGATWWVRLPPQGSRDLAERKAKELRGLGISDLFIVQEAGPNQFAISLGIFKTESAANQLLNQLRTRGVRSASVEIRGGGGTQYRIEVTAPSARISAVESNDTAHRTNCLL